MIEAQEVDEVVLDELRKHEGIYKVAKTTGELLKERLDLASRVPYTREEIVAVMIKRAAKMHRASFHKFSMKVMKMLLRDETRSVSPELVKDTLNTLVANNIIMTNERGELIRCHL